MLWRGSSTAASRCQLRGQSRCCRKLAQSWCSSASAVCAARKTADRSVQSYRSLSAQSMLFAHTSSTAGARRDAAVASLPPDASVVADLSIQPSNANPAGTKMDIRATVIAMCMAVLPVVVAFRRSSKFSASGTDPARIIKQPTAG